MFCWMATQAASSSKSRCDAEQYHQTHVAALYSITCVCVLSSCRRRTHKQGRGQLTQAPECGPASLGVDVDGPQSVMCAPQQGEQGDARAEAARRDGRGCLVCQAVLTGSQARSLARQADYHWERRNGGHTSGTVVVSVGMGPARPVIGAALPGKLDGLQWSASTVLLPSSLCFAPEISEPQSPMFMHCKTASKEPWERLFAAASLFRLTTTPHTALASSRCEWHMACLGPHSCAEPRLEDAVPAPASRQSIRTLAPII